MTAKDRLDGSRRPVAACYGAWVALSGFDAFPARLLGLLHDDVDQLLLVALTVLIMIGIGLYIIPAALLGGYLAVRHWFATADAHPMMPALCATAFGVAQLGRFTVEGFDPGRPWWVTFSLGLGGAVGLIGLAALELRLIRRAGVSLRSLPPRRR